MAPRYVWIVTCLSEEDDSKYNLWEQTFISDMSKRLEDSGPEFFESNLSQAQKNKLEEIWRK